MAYAPKDNSGSVFRNDRKREGKQDADFAGQGVVNGQEVWIDMWTKPPKDGKKGFFSISFRAKQPRGEQQPSAQRPGRPQPPQRERTAAAPARGLPPPPSEEYDTTIDPNAPDIPWPV